MTNLPPLQSPQTPVLDASASSPFDHPLGLAPGAPSNISLPNGSRIELVDVSEQLRLRYYGKAFLWAGYFFLLLMFVLIFASAILAVISPTAGAVAGVSSFLCMCMFFVFGLFHGFFRNIFIRRAIRKRPGKLFEPTRKSKILSAEDCSTFSKLKYFPDDYMVMHIEPGRLLIEMSHSRLVLMADDVRMETQRVKAGTYGLRLHTQFQQWLWEVTIMPPDRGMLSSEKKLAEKLWKQIYDGLTKT